MSKSTVLLMVTLLLVTSLVGCIGERYLNLIDDGDSSERDDYSPCYEVNRQEVHCEEESETTEEERSSERDEEDETCYDENRQEVPCEEDSE